MKILLVRHGEPDVRMSNAMNAVEFAKWVRAYNHAHIDTNSKPSEELCQLVANSFAVSSDLTRAVHSAELCIKRSPDMILKQLREFDIPRLKLPFVLSAHHWLVLSRCLWFLGASGKGESFSRARIRLGSAVDQLLMLAQEKNDITVFGHGMMHRFIAREFQRLGWNIDQKNHGYWGITKLVNNES